MSNKYKVMKRHATFVIYGTVTYYKTSEMCYVVGMLLMVYSELLHTTEHLQLCSNISVPSL